MKSCPSCKKELVLSSFGVDKKASDGLQSYCKKCAREYAQTNYAKKKQYYYDKAKRNGEHYQRKGRNFIWEYLSVHPCVDCGESDPLVLEFDHVRGEKRFNIISMMTRHASLKTLQEEILKCDIRCANCHRRKTVLQFGWWRDKWAFSS